MKVHDSNFSVDRAYDTSLNLMPCNIMGHCIARNFKFNVLTYNKYIIGSPANQMKCSVYSDVIIGPASAALARGLTFVQGNTSRQINRTRSRAERNDSCLQKMKPHRFMIEER